MTPHAVGGPCLGGIVWGNQLIHRNTEHLRLGNDDMLKQRWSESMSTNMGAIDRTARLVIGFALIAYAIPVGFAQTGWNWVGWIGVIPLLDRRVRLLPALYAPGCFHLPGQARRLMSRAAQIGHRACRRSAARERRLLLAFCDARFPYGSPRPNRMSKSACSASARSRRRSFPRSDSRSPER